MLDKTSYHPDRHNQIVSIKRSELLRHAEDSAGAELEGTPIHHAKNTGQTLIGRSGLLISNGQSFPSPSRMTSISLASRSR